MSNSAGGVPIEQLLLEQGVLYRPVEGNSMMPLLDQKTDLVKLIPCQGVLRQYDLPLYRRPNGALVLHRIIKVKKSHYVICGDNREIYERVPHDWVIGLAVGRVRDNEYLPFEGEQFEAYVKEICEIRDGISMRTRRLFRRVFPCVSDMKKAHPILKRCIILLPVMYGARMARRLLRAIIRR